MTPLTLAGYLWPKVVFFDKQREVIESVWRDDETFVPAGNMLGKDFVAAFIALTYFLCHQPCRVITTSVKDDHLRVLWGELKRFIQTMDKHPSNNSRLVVNYREIRRYVDGEEDPISYIHGTVSERGEGLAGHHAAHTLLIIDEASGVDDAAYEFGDTWAKHKLIIGNPNPCNNFFYRGVSGGDLKVEGKERYYRRIIKIKAVDSPNVKLGMAQKSTGKLVSDEELIPGIIGYNEYNRRRALWDPVRQCIGLDGEFYEGAEVLIFPPAWLNECEAVAATLPTVRKALTMGVDPGEGDAETCWVICDQLGVIHLHAMRTNDTSYISNLTVKLMAEYALVPECVYFDRGGGGKQHADYLRQAGYNVKTVAFGESVSRVQQEEGGYVPFLERTDHKEQKYAYRNRRAQMYGMLRERVDPTINEKVFALPREYQELRRQLSLIPLEYDGEGRMQLPPKARKNGAVRAGKKKCLIDIIGRSPDHADALVLAIYGMAQELELVLGPAF